MDINLFSQRLAIIRKEKGFSQEALGAAVGLSRFTVIEWEAGRKTPDLSTASKIAEILQVSLDFLSGNNLALGEQSSSSSSLTLQQPAAPPRSREIPYFGGDILTLLSLAREKIKAQAGTLTPDEREAVGMLLSLCARHLDGDEEQDHLKQG